LGCPKFLDSPEEKKSCLPKVVKPAGTIGGDKNKKLKNKRKAFFL